MPDWPTETITDQDPRYRELLAEEAEARAQFLASDRARAEIAAAAASRKTKTTWKPATPLHQNEGKKAIPWTRSP